MLSIVKSSGVCPDRLRLLRHHWDKKLELSSGDGRNIYLLKAPGIQCRVESSLVTLKRLRRLRAAGIVAKLLASLARPKAILEKQLD